MITEISDYGVDAAYKRLLALIDADNWGQARRVARELLYEAREAIIGTALFDSEQHPLDDSFKLLIEICKEENERMK